MCVYDSVLGSGEILVVQTLTVLVIAFSIVFWIWVYRRGGIGLRQYALPIALWMIFGTLDIIITAKGTFADAGLEANPLARTIFENVDAYGPMMASVLWIALWAALVYAVNKKTAHAELISLGIFYSLAVGHFLGFSSWFILLCGYSLGAVSHGLPRLVLIVVSGLALAAGHRLIRAAIESKQL